MNAGSAACEFARVPSHISRKSAAKTSLISGSITRFPYRPKNQGEIFGSPTMSVTDASTNGTIQIVGVMNRSVSPVTVAMSVTKVADISRLPTSSRLSPVSTSTA